MSYSNTRELLLLVAAFSAGLGSTLIALHLSRKGATEGAGNRAEPAETAEIASGEAAPTTPGNGNSEAPPVPARLRWLEPGSLSGPGTYEVSTSGPETIDTASSEESLTEAEEDEILATLGRLDGDAAIQPNIQIGSLRASKSRRVMEALFALMDRSGNYSCACIEALSGIYANAGFEEIPAYFESRVRSLDSTNLRLLMVWFPKPALIPTAFSAALVHEDARVRWTALRRVPADRNLYEISPGMINRALEVETDAALVKKVVDSLTKPR